MRSNLLICLDLLSEELVVLDTPIALKGGAGKQSAVIGQKIRKFCYTRKSH